MNKLYVQVHLKDYTTPKPHDDILRHLIGEKLEYEPDNIIIKTTRGNVADTFFREDISIRIDPDDNSHRLTHKGKKQRALRASVRTHMRLRDHCESHHTPPLRVAVTIDGNT